jgi:hypothetical protein
MMKAWIMRLVAAMAVATVLSGCAGFGGGMDTQSAMPNHEPETSLSD